MIRKDFAYFLTVTNVTPSEAAAVSELLKQEEYFYGQMRCYGSPGSEPLVFDLDSAGGSVSEIELEQVENAMHKLAMAFPKATLYLQAENVEDKSDQFEIQTHGNLYQYARLRSVMPPLSTPVPFEVRHTLPPEENFVDRILHGTDFDLLLQQKSALVEAIYTGKPVPIDVLEGIVNFLDVVEDWAEQEGEFTFPELSEPEKPSLNDRISKAKAKSEAEIPQSTGRPDRKITPSI